MDMSDRHPCFDQRGKTGDQNVFRAFLRPDPWGGSKMFQA